MNEDEYRVEKESLECKHHKEMIQLYTRYCEANNKVMLGDIITINGRTIKVESMSPSPAFGSDRPHYRYRGMRYTKTGKPFKSGEYDMLFSYV